MHAAAAADAGVMMVLYTCRCDVSISRFTDVCTSNSSLVPGELFLDQWRLNFTPMSVNLLALVVIIVVCRLAGYLVLRYLRRPQI